MFFQSHIGSPPILKDFVSWVTETGLLAYIRPVDGVVMPQCSMKCARIVLIDRAALSDLGEADFATKGMP